MTRLEYLKTLDIEEFVSYVRGHKQFNLGYKKLTLWLSEIINESEVTVNE